MPSQKSAAGQDIEALISRARRREKTVTLCLAGDLVGEYEALEQQLSDAAALVGDSLAGSSQRVPISERMEALRAEMAEHLVTFRFRALEPEAWSDLLAEHPGKSADHAFDLRTFGPAAVAACAVEPAMTAGQFQRLAKGLTANQHSQLLDAVWEINSTAVRKVPFSLLASATVAGSTGEK